MQIPKCHTALECFFDLISGILFVFLYIGFRNVALNNYIMFEWFKWFFECIYCIWRCIKSGSAFMEFTNVLSMIFFHIIFSVHFIPSIYKYESICFNIEYTILYVCPTLIREHINMKNIQKISKQDICYWTMQQIHIWHN